MPDSADDKSMDETINGPVLGIPLSVSNCYNILEVITKLHTKIKLIQLSLL